MFQLPLRRGTWLVLMLVCSSSQVRAQEPVHWRVSYDAARKEATEKGLPLLVEIGTNSCMYCQKQEVTTFRNPIIARLLNRRFVPLKIDANQAPGFVEAMKVTVYPTTVLAAPSGKILVYHAGYLTADDLQKHLEQFKPPTPPQP